MTKHMNVLFKSGVRPDRTYLSLGRGGSAEVLNGLEIEEHPFQFRYAEHMDSCFDLAQENPPSWLKNLNQ